MNLRAPLFLMLIIPAFVSTPILAIHELRDLEQVPLTRIISNLLMKNPQDAHTLWRLARAHVMVWAKGEQISDHDVTSIPSPPYIDNKGFRMQWYLKNAVKLYEQVFDKKHKTEVDPLGRLGYAWALDQLGNKVKAVEQYRLFIEEDKKYTVRYPESRRDWMEATDYLKKLLPEKEVIELDEQLKKDYRNWLDQLAKTGKERGSVWREVANRLRALLDEKKDMAEIKSLAEKIANDPGEKRMITPIIFSIQPNLSFKQLFSSKKVSFNLDGEGLKKWSWVSKDSAFLVWDPENKATIQSGLQLFGSVTFWIFWDNGYQALASLDDNQDGWISGDELAGIRVWVDSNGNGKSEKSEVTPLSYWKIVKISTHAKAHHSGIMFSPKGIQFSDGTFRPSYDVKLRAVEDLTPNVLP